MSANPRPWGIVDIHGTDYHTVAKRVTDFRSTNKIEDGWSIRTAMIEADPEHVVFRAEIVNPGGTVIATGYAQEQIGAMARGMASSMLEVAETSAVGRALAFAGFGGAQSEIASADEVLRRAPETNMSKIRGNKILRELVAKADADDGIGCLQIWDELNQDQQLWVMGQLDRVNIEKVNACLKAAQEARDGKEDPNLISPLPRDNSAKDQRRETVRAAR